MMTACTKIMVVRHAEKPDGRAGINGVTEAGVPDRDELSVRGWQRAGAMVRLFNPEPPDRMRGGLAVPAAIFATAPTGAAPSKRPVRTVEALARDLGLAVRTDFALHREEALAAAASGVAGTVLIAWHHERIGKIAAALGVDGLPGWHDDAFDQVLVLDRGGQGWTARTVLEAVLPGDRRPVRGPLAPGSGEVRP